MNRVFIDDCQHWLLDTDYPYQDGYDLIYIDPPYDTKSKFSYNDNRGDWCEWLRPKIEGAYNYLRDDGAIFISIDDNRLIELCLFCDEIFGSKNRVAIMITHQAQRSNSKHINVIHEYVVIYAKNKKKLPQMSIPRIYTDDAQIINTIENKVKSVFDKNGQEEAQKILRKELIKYKQDGITWLSNYRSVDNNGRIFYPQDLSLPGLPNTIDIPDIGIHLEPLPTRKWSSAEKIRSLYEQDLLEFLNDNRPYEKHYLKDAEDNISSILPFYSRQGTEDLKRLDCADLFDTPKPVSMIEMFILAMSYNKDKIRILDFFAGSGTTGQAAWQAQQKLGNKVDISFDLVQASEDMNEHSKPYKKALEIGIKPNIADALKYRLDKFISMQDTIECNYHFVDVSSER